MIRFLSLFVALTAFSSAAFGHHPLAGMPMSSFSHGLLSGLGHPIIGIDHFFFVMAVGVAAFYARSALLSPVFYLVGMGVGISVVLMGVRLPNVEITIALSLILLGAIIVSGRSMSVMRGSSLFVVLGLFHGYAFGESVVGIETVNTAVWAGYLIGLCAIQWLVAISAGYFGSKAWSVLDSAALRPRIMGAVTMGVGITFFVEVVESVFLPVS